MLAEVASARRTYRLEPGSRRVGGQAEVYRARGPDGDVVAVRIALASGGGAAWLPRETACVRDLLARHADAGTWIVPVLDDGTTPDGRPFGVHPWFDDTLASWIDRDPPLGRRLDALLAAAGAVVRLHRSPAELDGVLLHRDLKPDNFLVSEGPDGLRVVLADLGIGKAGRLVDETTNTGRYTPRYAPLEQTLPIERPPDPSADVHALAMTVYTCLCGRLPQTAVAQDGRFRDAARRLVTLDGVRRRTAEEEEQWRALRRAPLATLLDLEGPALLPVDEARLANALVEGGVDADVAGRLVEAVRAGLEADPDRRASDPRRIYAALRDARASLGEVAAPPAPVPAGPRHATAVPTRPGAAAVPTPPGAAALSTLARAEDAEVVLTVPSPRERPFLWIAGIVAAGLVAVTLGGVGVVLSRPSPSSAPPPPEYAHAPPQASPPSEAPEVPVSRSSYAPSGAGTPNGASPSTVPAVEPARREAPPPPPSSPASTAGRKARPGRAPAPSVDAVPAAPAPAPAPPAAPPSTGPRVSVTRLADADATFTLDGAPLPRAAMPVPLGAGTHTFTWTARGHTDHVTVDVAGTGAAWTVQATDGATSARLAGVAAGAALRVEQDGAGGLILR